MDISRFRCWKCSQIRFVFLLLIAFILNIFTYELIFANNAAYLTIVRSFTVVLFILGGIFLYSNRRLTASLFDPTTKVLLSFSGYVILTAIFYNDYTLSNIADMIKIVTLVLIIKLFFSLRVETTKLDWARLKFFIVAILISISLTSLIFIYPKAREQLSLLIDLTSFGNRFVGLRGNPNADAIYAAICLFIIAELFLFYRLSNLKKIFLIIGIISNGFVLLSSASRSSYLLTFFLLSFLAWFTFRKNLIRKYFIYWLLILAAGPTLLFTVNYLSHNQASQSDIISRQVVTTYHNLKDRMSVTDSRIPLWKECSKLTLHYPFGIGNRMLSKKCNELSSSFKTILEDMHNFILRGFVFYGFLGGALIVLFFALIGIQSARKVVANRSSPFFEYSLFCLFFMLGCVVRGLFDTDFFPSYTLLTCMFFIYYEQLKSSNFGHT